MAELVEIIRRQAPSTATLLEHCLQQWGVQQRGAYTLIKRARAIIREDFEDIDRADFMAQQIIRLELIYEKAMQNQCYPSAVGAVKELNSMLGIGFGTK